MLPWFHDASSGSTSSLTPWSCKLLHMAKLWGTQALKQDGEVRWAHGVRATRPLRKQRPSCSNPTVSFSLACAPRRVLRIRGALSMPRLSGGTLSDSPRNSAKPEKMQVRCTIAASIFARHAEALGSIPGGGFSFFAGLFHGFRIVVAPSLHNHSATGRGSENHARRRGSPHLAAYPIGP